MAPVKDRFCSFCGALFPEPLRYPRTCPNPTCAITLWANPIPVVVLLVPVEDRGARGLLCLRRGIEPQRGRLALVGGFLEEHERWQEGGAREVREEVSVAVEPAKVEPFWFASSAPKPNRVLLFGTTATVNRSDLGAFTPCAETLERGVLWGPDGLETELAFPLHLEAARRWFSREGITGPHRYHTV